MKRTLSIREEYAHVDNMELAELGLKTSSFWRMLETFGPYLKPVDRIAYAVSNYQKHSPMAYVNSSSSKTKKEHYLASIIATLSLETEDTVTIIIKQNLQKELHEIDLSTLDKDHNYYVLALYARIVGDTERVGKLLSLYVKSRTTKQVILDCERRSLSYLYNLPTFACNIDTLTFCINNYTFREEHIYRLSIDEKTINICYSIDDGEKIKQYQYELEPRKWAQAAYQLFVKDSILNWKQEHFEDYGDVFIEDDCSYVFTVECVNGQKYSFNGGTSSTGIRRLLPVIYDYFCVPENCIYKVKNSRLYFDVF